METPNQPGPDKLCAEILADARREGDELRAHARAEAAAMLAKANGEAEKIRGEERERARAAAKHRAETILSTVVVEIGRMWSNRIESVLESIRNDLGRKLAEVPGRRETLVALAAAAVGRMPERDFVLEVSAADKNAFGPGLGADILARTGRAGVNVTFSADGEMASGGVIVRDRAGGQYWDNRLRSRLERLWPQLRRQIAVQSSLLGSNPTPGGEA